MVTGPSYLTLGGHDADPAPPGPPSQSLGVDPIDHDVMRRPPRKKDDPIITQRIRIRVAFSAAVIVVGTLFVYYFALFDDQRMSRRDQTMVSRAHFLIYVFCSLYHRHSPALFS